LRHFRSRFASFAFFAAILPFIGRGFSALRLMAAGLPPVNKLVGRASKVSRRGNAMSHRSRINYKISRTVVGMGLGAILLAGCAGGAITTREKGAGIGALGGASVGGLIGSAVHHPAMGAAIGAALGLGAGALIGDQLQGRDNQAYEQDRQIYQNEQEVLRQRQELEQLRRRPEY
jgi:outer membrane protein with glycine zipper